MKKSLCLIVLLFINLMNSYYLLCGLPCEKYSKDAQICYVDSIIEELYEAFVTDDVYTINNILAKYPECINCCVDDKFQETLLHQACLCQSSYAMIEALIHKGYDVNAMNFRQDTPLFYLVIEPNADTVKKMDLLLKNGANINAQGNLGHTLLHRLISSYEMNDHKISCINFLLQNHIGVNLQDEYDYTPIQLAVKRKYFSVVEMLLRYKANPLIKNYRLNKTAIYMTRDKNIKRMLLNYVSKYK